MRMAEKKYVGVDIFKELFALGAIGADLLRRLLRVAVSLDIQ